MGPPGLGQARLWRICSSCSCHDQQRIGPRRSSRLQDRRRGQALGLDGVEHYIWRVNALLRSGENRPVPAVQIGAKNARRCDLGEEAPGPCRSSRQLGACSRKVPPCGPGATAGSLPFPGKVATAASFQLQPAWTPDFLLLRAKGLAAHHRRASSAQNASAQHGNQVESALVTGQAGGHHRSSVERGDDLTAHRFQFASSDPMLTALSTYRRRACSNSSVRPGAVGVCCSSPGSVPRERSGTRPATRVVAGWRDDRFVGPGAGRSAGCPVRTRSPRCSANSRQANSSLGST